MPMETTLMTRAVMAMMMAFKMLVTSASQCHQISSDRVAFQGRYRLLGLLALCLWTRFLMCMDEERQRALASRATSPLISLCAMKIVATCQKAAPKVGSRSAAKCTCLFRKSLACCTHSRRALFWLIVAMRTKRAARVRARASLRAISSSSTISRPRAMHLGDPLLRDLSACGDEACFKPCSAIALLLRLQRRLFRSLLLARVRAKLPKR